MRAGERSALRGALLTFSSDPGLGAPDAVRYVDDGLVVIADGRIVDCGPAARVAPTLPPTCP